MKRAIKLIALIMAVAMCLSFAACSNNDPAGDQTPQQTEPNGATPENRVILGNITELSGDFRYPGWGGSTAGASDQEINRLTAGYSTQEINRAGDYVWNETVVKNHTETENADGTYTIHIEINEGLTFSDGSAVTAQNYLAPLLAFGSPVAVGAQLPGTGGQSLVGYAEFNAYTGPDSAEGTKVFSGVRMLDDYTFELTVSTDYYPYYYAFTYGAVDCYPAGLMTGADVTVSDDGEGCYLSDNFYEKNGEDYVKAAEISENRYDTSKYPFSGAYTISEWDEGTKQATLTLNPKFKGNFEGQVPTIETIVYIKIVEETQLDQLKSGAVDVLAGVTGGELTKSALEIVDDTNFKETHYQRAGYGKIQFDCDFGPTMFTEVRQAITYLLDRTAFAQNFTGGYGVVVDGPYSPDFSMWQAVQDDIELIDYSYSLANAVKVLEDGGWIYNSKGEPFEAGAEGVDAVRYKKLTAEEANAVDIYGNDAGNKTYASVSNTDSVEYKTVEINGEYYMPLAINWFGSQPNTVTDMLSTTLANSTDLAEAGMVIRATTGDFTTLTGNIYRDPEMGYLGTPTYGMYNLATGWNTAMYDYSYNWMSDPSFADYSVNKLIDPYDTAFPYDITAEKLSFDEAMEASGGKLGMDYLSFGMVYNAKTEDEYNQWWEAYIERWNQLMPDIPLYSNYYYDVYNANIENFETSPFFGPDRAILYANIKGHAAS